MGASQSWLTRNRGRAPLTQTVPPARSTRQISDETPPASAVARGVSSGAASRVSRRNRSTGSGSEALNRPACSCRRLFALVHQAVVQAVGPALPELDRLRHDPISAPMRRSRRIVRIASARFLHGILEMSPRGDCFALRRRPCREPRAERAAGVIGVGGGGATPPDRTADAPLPLKIRPLEDEASRGSSLELAALAAAVVGVEDETGVLDAL